MTANDEEFQGTIRTAVLDLSNRPIPTEMTAHVLATSRPISLDVAKPKDVELMFYIPRRLGLDARTVTLEHRLISRQGGLIETQGGSVSLMPDYRFFHVVLSGTPARYEYLKSLPTNQLIYDSGVVQWTTVVTPRIDRYLPLPSDALAWTSIAALVWDDFDPERLDAEQKKALIDWLHFGGQIILSGPDALDRVKGSFLDPYLPATSTGSRALARQDLVPLVTEFDLPPRPGRPANPWRLDEQGQTLSIELALHPRARFVPRCGKLLADRAIGRGRIVVTAFSLHERGFREWLGADNFIHNALFLRPSRDFREPGPISEPARMPMTFIDVPGLEKDPRMSSSVRFFSRDWGRDERGPREQEETALASTETQEATADVPRFDVSPDAVDQRSIAAGQAGDVWRLGPYVPSDQSGIAGWNDRSQVATEARQVLSSATGIEPPSVRFVAIALVVYLILLVPINAIVFRTLNRIEWAWIAAPVIAVVAAVIVARAARLDVGFARSRTELVLVELAADHPRAHVTRFTTLYTSLSTEFEIEFDSSAARAQPWGDPAIGERSRVSEPQPVTLDRSGLMRLSGFDVPSNSAGLVHTEEFLDVAGSLTWTQLTGNRGQVENRSRLVITDAIVVAPFLDQQMGFAKIDRLGPGEVVVVSLQEAEQDRVKREIWGQSSETRSHRLEAEEAFAQMDVDQDGRLSLRELRTHPDFTEQWSERLQLKRSSAFQESNIRRQSELDLEEWTELSRFWLRGRLHVGGLLELWLDRSIEEHVGPQLAGLIESVPDTSRVIPSPSQVRTLSMVVAALEPTRLPEPGHDHDLPSPSVDLAVPMDFEDPMTP